MTYLENLYRKALEPYFSKRNNLCNTNNNSSRKELNRDKQREQTKMVSRTR
jgi:hypothetical protein